MTCWPIGAAWETSLGAHLFTWCGGTSQATLVRWNLLGLEVGPLEVAAVGPVGVRAGVPVDLGRQDVCCKNEKTHFNDTMTNIGDSRVLSLNPIKCLMPILYRIKLVQ